MRKVVEVTPETQEIVIEIEKVLPWRERGWVTADTHVHFLSPMSALLEGAAEGVNVVNLLASQWGELMTNVGDFDGQTTWGSREAGGDGEYLVRVGTENRQHVLGHISLLGYSGRIIAPMTTGGPDESALGDPIEILLTEWARQCKQQGGVVVLPHFPNPRAEHAASIVSGDVDAVEMTSWGDLYGGIDPYSLSDWYRYLNCGYLVAAVGGTDKMTANTAVGTVRTYARIAPGKPFTYEAWMEAVRRGRDLRDLWPAARVHGGRPARWAAASMTVCQRRHGGRDLAGRQRHRADVARRAGRERRDPRKPGGVARTRPAGTGQVQGRSERLAGAAGARALRRQARDHRRALLAGDGRGRRARRCWPPPMRSPSSSRSKAPWPTWTRSARAPRTAYTSACAWCWNRRTAPCTTGCTRQGTITSTPR